LKVIATVLLALLMLNSFFYCLYCNICIWQREAEVKEMVADQNFGGAVTIVKIPSASTGSELETKDELWYNKSLYDVIKRQVVKDTLYVYMVADEEEENFVNRIDAFITAGDECCYNSACTVHTEKTTVKIISQHYTCTSLPGSFFRHANTKHFGLMQPYICLVAGEIITPPPRRTFA